MPKDLVVRIRGNIVELQAAGSRARAILKRVDRTASDVTRGVRRVGTGIGTVAAGITAATVAVGKLAERGGRVEGVLNGFARVTGDAGGSLKLLREQTRGLVADFDLVTQFNQALATGAADSVKGFGRLARTSQDLGRALGIDATTALEKFSIALARQSKLRLDDLGIVLDVGKANADFAKSIGVNVSALSDEQKAMAFREAAFAQADILVGRFGASNLKAADNVARLQATTANFLNEAATQVNNSEIVIGFFDRLADTAGSLLNVLEAGKGVTGEGFAAFGAFLGNRMSEGILRGVAAALGGGVNREVLPFFLRPLVDGVESFFGAMADDAKEAGDAWGVAFDSWARTARKATEARAAASAGGGVGGGGGGGGGVSIAGAGGDPSRLFGFRETVRPFTSEAVDQLTVFRDRMNESVQHAKILGITFDEIKDTFEPLNAIALDFAFTFADAIGSAVTDGVASFARFRDQVVRMLSQIAARFAVFKLLQAIPGIGSVATAFGSASGFIAPRAFGGHVANNRPYLVGERGPELFTPGTSGSISSSSSLRATLDVSGMPAATNPLAAARDGAWLRFLSDSVRELNLEGAR